MNTSKVIELGKVSEQTKGNGFIPESPLNVRGPSA
jgi:hypothetical protein